MKKIFSQVIIIILSIIVVLLAGYIIWDKYAPENNDSINDKDTQINTEEKQEVITEQSDSLNQDIEFKNYNMNNIESIIITTAIEENEEPVEKTHAITKTEEIIEILKVLDTAEYVNDIPEGIGFIYPTSIEVKYKEDPSVSIIFMDNGNVAINYVLGVAETRHAEYSLKHENFETEIIKKYFS